MIASTSDYSEDALVEQPAIELFGELDRVTAREVDPYAAAMDMLAALDEE